MLGHELLASALSLCPILQEEDESRWIVRVEDIFRDEDGDELFYMSYFYSAEQLQVDGARNIPKLAARERMESINVYPASLKDIIGFVHVVPDQALTNGSTAGSRDGLPIYFVNAHFMYNEKTKKFPRTAGSGVRLNDLVRLGTG